MTGRISSQMLLSKETDINKLPVGRRKRVSTRPLRARAAGLFGAAAKPQNVSFQALPVRPVGGGGKNNGIVAENLPRRSKEEVRRQLFR